MEVYSRCLCDALRDLFLVYHVTHNPLVVGSSPTGPTIIINELADNRLFYHLEIMIFLAVILAVKTKV